MGLPIIGDSYQDLRLLIVMSSSNRGVVVLKVPKREVYFEVYEDFAKIMPGDHIQFSWRHGSQEKEYDHEASYLKPTIIKNDYNIAP